MSEVIIIFMYIIIIVAVIISYRKSIFGLLQLANIPP